MSKLTNEASRFVDTASREPLGMSLTLLTTSSPSPGRSTCERMSASFADVPSNEGGISPEAITPRLHQQVVIAEIEQFFERRDVLARFQVDAREPQDRLRDDAHAGLDWRTRLGIAAEDAEVNRDVQDAGMSG